MHFDKNMNILVVDDYETMRRVVQGLLNQIGFSNVDEAAGGAEAIEKMRAKAYSLVISDLDMEPMNGVELVKHARSKGLFTPFLMLTAEQECRNLLAAKRAGIRNYLVKPFNAEALGYKIDHALAAHGAH